MEFLNVSLADMQIFAEAYRQKSFSEAAQTLFISRQSVARGIQNMEDILDVKLFTRSSHGIHATAAGNELYARCTPIIQSTYDMLCYMKEYKRRSHLQINMGFLGNIKSTRTSAKIISHFMELYPDVTVNRTELEGVNVQEALLSGQINFAFINLDLNTPNDSLNSVCLEEEEYLLVVRKDHPLTALQKVSAEALSGSSILFLSRYGIAVQIFENWMNRAGAKDYTVIKSGEIGYVQTCIMEDNAAAFLPKNAANVIIRPTPQVVGLPFSPPLKRHAGLVYRKDAGLTKEQQTFVDFFCSEYKKAAEASLDSPSAPIC